MEVDIGNALATVADPGLSDSMLADLDHEVAAAHERITTGQATREEGYAAMALPETVPMERIRSVLQRLPESEHVLVIGIGGSGLGAATLAGSLGVDHRVHVLDNLDPTATGRLLDRLPLDDTIVQAVSKSGRTVETLANTAIVTDAMAAAGVNWRERTFVTTGTAGDLAEFANRHELPRLNPPQGVPGRFAALSTVGLPSVGAVGVDLDALLDGAERVVQGLEPSLSDTPAYAYGATSYALAEHGQVVNAMMPYAEALEPFAEWFAQLWAESLGKQGTGQVPARALGVTDQHSQLQLYRAGPPVVQVSFVDVKRRLSRQVPSDTAMLGTDLDGKSLETLLRESLRATEASLAAAGRPNVRLTIEDCNPHSIGELLMTMKVACILAGELFEVDTFVQPAVEWSKRALRARLAGEETAEAAAIEDKHRLVVQGP